MFSHIRHAVAVTAALSLFTLVSGVGTTFAADDPGVPPPQTGSHVHTDRRVCEAPAAGTAACHALIRTDADATAARPASGRRPPKVRPDVVGNNGAYDPSYLQSAYQTPSAGNGAGQTVAIVDAYDQPNAASDLAQYRSYFALPAIHGTSNTDSCTVAAGPFPCFQKVNQSGGATPPSANASWGQEISLDIDMVSAICPNCNILLVEGNSATYNDLGTAVNTAIKMGASAVSNSYGGGEFSSESSYDTSFYNHPGVAITVSSGDNGYGVEYPAASQYVTAVGGTTLNQATNTGTRNATETVWSGAGSGCSAYEGKPTWQKDAGCARRTVSDVSAEADPNTGVWVYDSYAYLGRSGWLVFGGTSVAAPIVGSVYALAGSGASGTYPSSYPYSASSGSLNDVTSGSNGSCGGTYLCTGEPGYDGPTGLGTPNSTGAFAPAALAPAPVISSLVPASGLTTGGTAVTITGTNFTGTRSVSFGSTAAKSFTFNSDTTITAVSPAANAAGTVTVSVTTASGASTANPAGANQFTYTLPPAPAVSSISPTSGPTTGGTSVTISGTNFTNASAVNFGATAATKFTVASNTQITATSPANNSTAAVDVTVTTPSGTSPATSTQSPSSTADQFTYVQATFTMSASPTSQTVSAGQSTSYTVTLTTSSGYNSLVTLGVSGLPAGSTATFSPSSINPSSTSNSSSLKITTSSSSTPVASYPLTITNNQTSDTASVTLSVTAAATSDYTISASPSSLTIRHGSSGTYTVTLTAIGSYTSSVPLSVTGLPSGATVTYSQNPATVPSTPTITIATPGWVSRGTFPLTIQGDATHQANVSLTIR